MDHPIEARRTLHLQRSPFEVGVIVRLAVVAAVLVGMGTLLGLPLADGAPPGFDAELSARATAEPGTAAAAVAGVLSDVGHLLVVSLIAAAVALLARWRSGRWDVALLLAAVLGGATVVTGLVKTIVDRARPDGATVDALSAAFPSGHTVRAAAVLGLIAWIIRVWSRHPFTRATVVPLGALLIVANGLARVVLGVHWPTDVLVGLAIGTVWLLACVWQLRPAAR
ncbi:phosphatase PAP2 family protein [Nitriliruptor alkaliphilus]|uniref:phosphatase PAP2 family protein n=1 Tax=Nitriliruptor alkaliphilus TaxID=427918 RepID=UPI0014706F46|nr:phosphatase PAP2 family protein [Nitriliruptor alkaliphilus]